MPNRPDPLEPAVSPLAEASTPVPLSIQWEQHRDKWLGCTRCPLCRVRRKVCLARGDIPCHLLFIAEGPGFSEDTHGIPLIGPAGQLLDRIVKGSIPPWVKMCFSNLVGCLTVDEYTREKIDPPDVSVEACQDRVLELVNMAQPQVIICVGKQSHDWLDVIVSKEGVPRVYQGSIPVDPFIPRISIVHPSHILKSPVARRGLDIQRCQVILSNVVEDYLGNLKPREQDNATDR